MFVVLTIYLVICWVNINQANFKLSLTLWHGSTWSGDHSILSFGQGVVTTCFNSSILISAIIIILSLFISS